MDRAEVVCVCVGGDLELPSVGHLASCSFHVLSSSSYSSLPPPFLVPLSLPFGRHFKTLPLLTTLSKGQRGGVRRVLMSMSKFVVYREIVKLSPGSLNSARKCPWLLRIPSWVAVCLVMRPQPLLLQWLKSRPPFSFLTFPSQVSPFPKFPLYYTPPSSLCSPPFPFPSSSFFSLPLPFLFLSSLSLSPVSYYPNSPFLSPSTLSHTPFLFLSLL